MEKVGKVDVFGTQYTVYLYFEMTLRHELTHAFLYEIGNTNCDNEEFIDKLSKWVPKLDKLFKDGMGLMKNAKLEKK